LIITSSSGGSRRNSSRHLDALPVSFLWSSLYGIIPEKQRTGIWCGFATPYTIRMKPTFFCRAERRSQPALCGVFCGFAAKNTTQKEFSGVRSTPKPAF